MLQTKTIFKYTRLKRCVKAKKTGFFKVSEKDLFSFDDGKILLILKKLKYKVKKYNNYFIVNGKKYTKFGIIRYIVDNHLPNFTTLPQYKYIYGSIKDLQDILSDRKSRFIPRKNLVVKLTKDNKVCSFQHKKRFDILYSEGKDLTTLEYRQRREYLDKKYKDLVNKDIYDSYIAKTRNYNKLTFFKFHRIRKLDLVVVDINNLNISLGYYNSVNTKFDIVLLLDRSKIKSMPILNKNDVVEIRIQEYKYFEKNKYRRLRKGILNYITDMEEYIVPKLKKIVNANPLKITENYLIKRRNGQFSNLAIIEDV